MSLVSRWSFNAQRSSDDGCVTTLRRTAVKRQGQLHSSSSAAMLGYFKRVEDASGTKRGEAGPSSASNNASNASNASSNSNNKRPRVTTTEEGEAALKGGKSPPNPVTRGDPLTIVTWNANGLGVRLGKDWQDLQDFLTTNTPDVCCIQEVPRCHHALPFSRYMRYLGKEGGRRRRAFHAPFSPVWFARLKQSWSHSDSIVLTVAAEAAAV